MDSYCLQCRLVPRDIAASQEDLRGSFLGVYSSLTAHGSHGFSALVARVRTVQKEVDKLTAGNETLQMYIDNLTMQMAKRR